MLTFVDKTMTALAFCAISRARMRAKPPPPAMATRMVMVAFVSVLYCVDHGAWEPGQIDNPSGRSSRLARLGVL